MAKNKAPKKRWWTLLREAYIFTKGAYAWLPWGLLGVALLGAGIMVIVGAITHAWIAAIIMAVLLALLFPLILLTSLVRRASYASLDGQLGASAAILDSLGRGWDVRTEPIRFNPRSQELLFRAIGRPGVVILAEGHLGRAKQLVNEERKAIKRVASNAPVHVIYVGNDEGQTPLSQVEKKIRKLPKAISPQEIAALARRLDAINPNNLPIPKGIDPTRTRVNRRAMRG